MMSVDPRFLEGAYLKRYGKIAKNIERAYVEIVRSVPKNMPQVPTVYPTPYVIQQKRKIEGTRQSVNVIFYNLSFLDPDDLKKRAIYSTIEFFEKFPKYIRAGFGHELAHLIAEGNRKLTEKDLLMEQRNPIQAIKEREARKNKALTLFPMGLQSIVREWDTLSSQKQTVTRLLDGAWIVQMGEFREFVFGDKHEELQAILKEIANEALGLNEDKSKGDTESG